MSRLPQASIDRLIGSLATANVQAFLRVIREGETSQDDIAYRTMFGGGTFESFAAHPRNAVTKQLGRQPLTSTAAGAYQFLSKTWDECADALGLTDFAPASQDLAAVFLINRRRSLDDVIAGRFEAAVSKCAREWASLPGSPYGQPVKTMDQARATFQKWGGVIASTPEAKPSTAPAVPATSKEVKPMPFPFLAAALPALIDAVPKLAKLFGSGSEVSERNVKAAEMVVGIAKEAIGVRNEQELVETIASDPNAVQAVRDAIDANWGRIDEIGGGIAAARQANIAGAAIPPKRNMALWITLLLLPLVYITVCAVLFGADWSQDVKAMVVSSIVTGVLGGIMGYWLGTSFSSAKKDERAVEQGVS